MYISATIHVLFQSERTWNEIKFYFESLGLKNLIFTKLEKSNVYNIIDYRYYESSVSFQIDTYDLSLKLLIDEDEYSNGIRVIELEASSENTFDFLISNTKLFETMKVNDNVKKIAFVVNDETAPTTNIFDAFFKGSLDLYLQ